MTDAKPMTRPDLDALIANLREDPRDLGLILQETMVAAADSLEAERARADQAEGERDALARVIEQAHAACTSCWGTGVVYVAPDSGEACDEAFHRVLSAAPTAEPAPDPNRCPSCRHAEHGGFECLNMASDNDCACTYAAIPTANH